MRAVKGYVENGQFYPMGTVTMLPGRIKAVLTILDESVQEQEETPQYQSWVEFFEVINASSEDVPETFERVNFGREVEI